MEHKEHKKTEHHDKHVEHKKHDKHEVHHEKKVAHHSKTKSKISPWQIATALLAVLFVASVFTNGFSSTESTESLSTDEIESKAFVCCYRSTFVRIWPSGFLFDPTAYVGCES